jgi:hypothetical protein
MVAKITFTDNSAEIANDFSILVKKMPQLVQRSLAKVSAFEVASIKNRTQNKGIDAFGKKFAPYSKKNKRARRKQSGVVDLTDTGQMFSALTFKSSRSKGELFFRSKDATDKASYHDLFGAGKNKVKRQFFRISKKEQSQIQKQFNELILKGLGL